MIIAILLILFIWVLYVYVSDTFHHLIHAIEVTGRMVLVLLGVLLVLGLGVFYWFKFGAFP